VWFAFFVVADSRLAHVEHQAEVSYLVASASLGLAWSGPLAVLAGMRLYPGVYDLWQPFYGGFVFVLLQAFGWLFYSCTLIFCILALANIASGQWHTTMVDGGFVAVGVVGLTSGILLNMSLDYFDESLSASAALAITDADTEGTRRPGFGRDAQRGFDGAASDAKEGSGAGQQGKRIAVKRRRSAYEVLCTGKTVIAILLSLFGLLLFLVCDTYRDRLPAASLPVATLPFVGAAVLTQCMNGPSQLPGYLRFQPFRGGMSFVLLQAFSWFSFGGVVQTVLLVRADRIGEVIGIIPACGITGLASQLLLLSSLPHFDEQPAGSARLGREGGRRGMFSSEAFLSLCFYAWATIIFVGSYALERGALERWPVPMDTRGLWFMSMFLLAVATPSAHFAGNKLHELGGYRVWQPFCGGTMFCVAQGFGWMLYGVFHLLLLIYTRRVGARSPSLSNTSDALMFCVGSLAYAMIAFSLEHYDPRATLDHIFGTERQALSQQSPTRVSSLAYAQFDVGVAWTGEMRASVVMSAFSLLTCLLVDLGNASDLLRLPLLSHFEYEDLVAMTSLLLASVAALFAISAALMHVGASRRLRHYQVWMPFQGGDGFVVRQALGWTMFAMSQVVLWMLVLTDIERVTLHGIVFGAGTGAACAQYLLFRSLDFFEREQVTVKLSGLADPALTVQRLSVEIELLQRLLASADQPLVSRVLQSILAQLEERAAEASSHGAAARPLNVLLTPRAMQLVNLCLILVSTGALLLADALRSTQPQVAQVLLATGVGLAVYTVTFSHAFLGRLFHPSYRVFQPFIGGRYYVLLQAVGWTFFGIALVASVTIMYAQIGNVTIDGVVATVGVILFLAQLLIAISVFAYKPPNDYLDPSPEPASLRRPRSSQSYSHSSMHPGEWTGAGGWIQATHGQAIALMMSLSALVLFVIADIAPARLGADGVLIGVPTAPIIVCALVGLCGSVGVTYLISCTQMPCRVAIDMGKTCDAEADETPESPPKAEHRQTLIASCESALASSCESALSRPPLASSSSSSEVTLVLAGRGRFLVSHIFGCALLSLTFLRAALVELHRFETQPAGQNTRTGLSGLFAILLLLCSQSSANSQGLNSEAETLTIRLDSVASQLLQALGSGVDRRTAVRVARMLLWRLSIGLRPLSVAAALLATLAVRERINENSGLSHPHFCAPPNLLAAEAFLYAQNGANINGTVSEACAVWPLALAAARVAPQPMTLFAVAVRLGAPFVSFLPPGQAVILIGFLLSAAAFISRLALATRQQHANTSGSVQPQVGIFGSGVVLSESEIPFLQSGILAQGLRRLRDSARHSPDQFTARALALLQGIDSTLNLRSDANFLNSDESRTEGFSAAGGLSAIERLTDEELQDTLGTYLPVSQLAALSLCSKTLRSRLPPSFWRLRFVHEHGPGLSLPPYRMVLPTLRACAAPQRFPGKPLGALLAQQWPSLCRVSLKHASSQPPALCCESLEGIRWKRACVLADQGATLRYCAICSHLDQDLDSPSSFFPSSLPGAPVAGCDGGRGGGGGSNGGENGGGDGGGEVERARKAIRATEWLAIASEWVVLPDCPQHAPLSALQNSLRSGGEGKEGQRQLLRAEGGKDGEGRQWEQAAGRPKPVTVHRACLERAASVREGRATTSIFACPCCAAPLRVGERPARSWAELFGALEAADVRPYARCTLLLVAAVLIGLWALELACVLAEHRDDLVDSRSHSFSDSAYTTGVGELNAVRALRAVLGAVVPHARRMCFAVHLGALFELLASRHAWSAIASARSASEHARHVAIAAALCVCAVVELSTHSAVRLRSLHPLFALALPHALACVLAAVCSLLFFAVTEAVLLNAWCARSVVLTPRAEGADTRAPAANGV